MDKWDGEHCQICGEGYATVYYLDDDVWEKIKPPGKSKGAGLLCPKCADERAREHGIVLYWNAHYRREEMTFDKEYSDMQCWMQLEWEGDFVIKTEETCPCSICKKETVFMSGSFQAYYCSKRCLTTEWLRYETAEMEVRG